ncbi:MAG: tRNA (adenosine(37)-N6)-threonylcarbamoyltransferase complex ATPase subunit type 1 TsaE [Candidatus Paceibacterota bacterium]|jgi:tRNA threonylcarbamoyladenosine biosynthesis protein TsaE
MIIQSISDSQTESIAADFVLSLLKKIKENPTKGAYVVGLQGELGAGKTAFTKGVARAFGLSDTVTSPTFVIEKIYSLPETVFGAVNPFKKLIHIDAYRLDGGVEIEHLGWKEISEDPTNLILIEWPEQVKDAVSPTEILLFSFVDDVTRKIELEDYRG